MTEIEIENNQVFRSDVFIMLISHVKEKKRLKRKTSPDILFTICLLRKKRDSINI